MEVNWSSQKKAIENHVEIVYTLVLYSFWMEHTNNSVYKLIEKPIENLPHVRFKIHIGKHIKIRHNFLIYSIFFSL